MCASAFEIYKCLLFMCALPGYVQAFTCYVVRYTKIFPNTHTLLKLGIMENGNNNVISHSEVEWKKVAM